MRVSDTVGGHILAFLRTAGDSDHHVLAFAHADRPGFHHASFEVGSLDEIVLGAERVVEAGYRSAWGMGRHVGSNFFHYLRDPERHGRIFLGHRLRARHDGLGRAGLGAGGRLLPLVHRRPAAG
jgi:hypothetical protein